jgi:hypothetical protein
VRTFRRAFLNIFWMMGAVLLWSHSATTQETVASIIQQAREANERDWAAAPDFDWQERDRTKDEDKTYAVIMLYGSPYRRLIAVNGHTLSSSRQKEEQNKYESAVAERQHESPDKRSERIAKYQTERRRDHTLIEQMTTAFDFHLLGKRLLNGYAVYVLKATPRKGYEPPNRDSEVLPGMEGMLWIDQKTFQWVKVAAQVIHPVRIEGFIAEVRPGTKFELDKRPVASDIWLASHFSMKANAKIMFLFPHRGQENDWFFNYHRAENTAANE